MIAPYVYITYTRDLRVAVKREQAVHLTGTTTACWRWTHRHSLAVIVELQDVEQLVLKYQEIVLVVWVHQLQCHRERGAAL